MLTAVTLPTTALAAAHRAQMHALMATHYEGVDYERFVEDLLEKERVILLLDRGDSIQGFTTLMGYSVGHPATRQPVRILYSGDTIIDRKHWGSQAGTHYDPARGIVHFGTSRGHLRQAFAEADAAEQQRSEVAFFLQRNPGYVRGDELVCLTELCTANLKPLSRRVFEKGLRDIRTRTDARRLETNA